MNSVTLDPLKQTFAGEIIQPKDPSYEEESSVFLHTGAPAVIFKPKTSVDVASAISYARDNNLILSVRSGGHSGAGFGTNTGGVVIDVSHFNTIEIIDKEKHIVRIGSGARWIEVAQALKEHGLAISSGDTKTVGVGGLTLGGGIGWMVRKVGLAIDNLVAAEVVTAEGKVLRASSDENPDLFWAIRGGGGNFGVVTYFEFTAYPIQKVFAGPISYGIEDLESVLKGWRNAMRQSPDELTTMALVLPSFGGNPPAVMILCCYAGGGEAEAMKVIDPFLKFGKVLMNGVKEKDYGDVLEDAHAPEGVEVIANNVFIKEFNDDVITEIVNLSKTAIPILQIRYLGAAVYKVPIDATAFPHRASEVLLVSPTFMPLNATPDVAEAAKKPWLTLAKFGQGAYGNLLSTTTEADTAAVYPKETYDKLVKVKQKYDPKNLFSQNYNIKPN